VKQIALRADDADLAVCDLDALGERAEMVAAKPPPSILIRSRAVLANSGPSAA
jgi:hypothetical protein